MADRYPRAFWALCAARLTNRVGAFSLAFLTLLLVQRGHLSVPRAGLVAGAFSAATVPSRLLGGRLADRWSARGTVLLGLLLTAAAQLALCAARGAPALAGAAVLLGLAFEVYEPACDALVVAHTTAENRSAAYTLLGVAIEAGSLAAGLLGAVLAGAGVGRLFLADAASCLLAAAIVAVAVPPCTVRPATGRGNGGRGSGGRSRSRVVDRRLLRLTALACLFTTGYFALLSVLPLTMARRGLAPGGVGLVLAVSSAVGLALVPPVLRLLRGRSDRAVLRWAYLVMAGGFVLTGVARSLPGFLAAAAVWTVGDLLVLGRAQAVVAERVAPADTASAMAFYGLSWSVGGLLAPVAGTLLLSRTGPACTWAAFAALLTVPALMTGRAARP
ncbi:MFS transporter [Kitasatospora sp. NPDC058965]|uniref:MFS transporter n=1 Tax=Kitasatospora sp. NPDC058965 TaxID=3346682 RepID=UPI003680ADE9